MVLAKSHGDIDDWLLKRAVASFGQGDFGDALAGVEAVCRHRPRESLPAMFRAKIVATISVSIAARAWYIAWRKAPQDPVLQDGMLRAWLESGAADVVRSLGQAFLPQRCQSDNSGSLLAILFATQPRVVGACWKGDGAIEIMVLIPNGNGVSKDTAVLQVTADSAQSHHQVPTDGSIFRLQLPEFEGVYSLSITHPQIPGEPPLLLSGSPLVFASAAPRVAAPSTPAASKKSRRVALTRPPAARVHIVIPIYRGIDHVVACVSSVLESLGKNKTSTTLTLINDASPEPAVAQWLKELEQQGQAVVLTNPHNLGFIETCNRALRLCTDGDILLLNADTLVHGHWVDRLHTSLHQAPDVASVTPWSNNGEVTSYPQIGSATQHPTPGQLAEIDAAAASLRKSGRTADIEIPSGCGFAMLMRREAIDSVGYLDGVELNRGYSEEVDWCRRASSAGYRHLACTSVFIAHAGKASFSYEKHLRVAQNKVVIAARYPDYYDKYHQFLRDDPLKAERATLSQALVHMADPWPLAPSATAQTSPFPNPLPQALPSSRQRIGVWQQKLGTRAAAQILQLARHIASQASDTPDVRLVIVGDITPAYLQTGVVDAMRRSEESPELTLFSDGALLALLGCKTVLTDVPLRAPDGMRCEIVGENFEPRAWFEAWLHSVAPRATSSHRQRKSGPQSVRKPQPQEPTAS